MIREQEEVEAQMKRLLQEAQAKLMFNLITI